MWPPNILVRSKARISKVMGLLLLHVIIPTYYVGLGDIDQCKAGHHKVGRAVPDGLGDLLLFILFSILEGDVTRCRSINH